MDPMEGIGRVIKIDSFSAHVYRYLNLNIDSSRGSSHTPYGTSSRSSHDLPRAHPAG
jgi:hypothetical protein